MEEKKTRTSCATGAPRLNKRAPCPSRVRRRLDELGERRGSASQFSSGRWLLGRKITREIARFPPTKKSFVRRNPLTNRHRTDRQPPRRVTFFARRVNHPSRVFVDAFTSDPRTRIEARYSPRFYRSNFTRLDSTRRYGFFDLLLRRNRSKSPRTL